MPTQDGDPSVVTTIFTKANLGSLMKHTAKPLPTQACGEEDYSVYLQGTKQGEGAANAQRPQPPSGFQARVFKD